jgi:Fe-S cluster assembly ATP-binding protein
MTNNMLKIENLEVHIGDKKILNGINLIVKSGTLHAIMGPNGSGKSTMAAALMGNPDTVIGSIARLNLNGKNLIPLSTSDRAKSGLFLAFQSPVSIPGVSVINLLRSSFMEIHGGGKSAPKINFTGFRKTVDNYASQLKINHHLLSRSLGEGFSGGEKKKIEILTALVLQPKFAVFDEIDTGLDVDALNIVASGIETLKSQGTGIIVITHYQRILKYLKPDYVHILVGGKIVKSGDYSLAGIIDRHGYQQFL